MKAPFPAWFRLILVVALIAAGATSARSDPATLSLHSGIYDPSRQQMVIFGGVLDSLGSLQQTAWRLGLGLDPRWTLDSVAPFSARAGHSAIYDPIRDRMLVFGGSPGNLQILQEVWTLSLSDGIWSEIHPSGTSPPARYYHSAVYDGLRDRMVVFGGLGESSNLDDVWFLWLSPSPRWEQVVLPVGAIRPIQRYSHSAIYDPVRDRMIVFAGSPNLLQNDLWAFSLANQTWSPLAPTGTPPAPRFGHSAIYDPIEDRMIVFGGSDGNQYLDEVLSLSLTNAPPSWSRVTVTGTAGARVYHSAIYDSTYRRMVIFGGPNVPEPTWSLSLGSSPRWSPLRPLIGISPTELLLQPITVGDTVAVPFVVSDVGMQPLDIASFDVPTPDVRVVPSTPERIVWNATQAEVLWFAPSTPGLLEDSLVIVSNDPVTPRRRVRMSVEVHGLEFDTHVLGSPDSVAPGVSFIVVVTPRAGVRVERGQLFYRVAGTSSPFDSLTLTPLATDFIAAVPATAVTERGVEYYAKLENSPFAATQPAGAPAVFSIQKVSAPEAITAVVPRPNSGSDFLVSQDVPVDVVLPDGAIFDSGTLSFRRGGEAGSQTLPLTASGTPGQVSATIPDSLVGPRGVEYWVDVRTLRSTLRYPVAGGPAFLRTKVANLVEPAAHPGGRYRLLTVPLDFAQDFTGALDALLSDQLGTYANTRWRAFSYDAIAGNVEFSSGDIARFRPKPGRAFWLISKSGHRVDTKPVAGLSTSTAGNYAIPLVTGWNLIGNPYDFPVAWADVIRAPAVVEDPIGFDPARGTIGDYASAAAAVLEPFEGYFVYATRADTLRVPPRESSPSPQVADSKSALGDPSAWELSVVARTDAAVDASARLGMRADARKEFDPLDRRKPPSAPGAGVRVVFPHHEWGERAGQYQVDLRAPGTEGELWDIEVTSSVAGEVVTLDWSRLAPPAPGAVLGIVDREQGTTSQRDLDDEASGQSDLQHRIVSFGPRPYRLAIVVGTSAYVKHALDRSAQTPMQAALDANAPNPFRFATRLRFSLPRTERVRLEIFSVRGERVATLLDGSRLDPGIHAVVWDGRRSTGEPLPSGVYLVRLDLGREVLTRRVVLVR